MKTYDVLVIGGGSAGTSAASTAAAALGPDAKVGLFNKGELGGLCILRGCMPTKTLLHAGQLLHEASAHHTPGLGHGSLSVDFEAVMANKNAKVARFKKAKLGGIAKGGYEVIDAYARFSGPDTIDAEGTTYRFTKGAVLAAGSDVSLPPIPGIENVTVWDSDSVMEITEVPESAIVMGGGAIGLELGLFLARVGCKVIQANRSRIFSKLDPELADEMQAVLEAEPNMTLVAPFNATGIEEQDGEVRLHLDTAAGPRTLVAKHFIAATGRDARIADMGLEAAGVEFSRGRVKCDDAMRTTNPRIFVAGDATGEDLLLHIANWEGKAAGKGAAEVPGDHAVERRLHMTAIFTDPPLATIGMTQMEAEAAGIPVVCASAKLAQTGRAITMDVQHGLWKMIAHKQTGELLGSQILGPRADDIIHIISTAMYYKGTAMDLLEMPWYHPTLSEVGLSLARELVCQVEL
ncbi:MAG: pyruvate/2-oxoglutarate dehydrogenase complex dihydrolipoamide dehydrogenase (E3) component [Candidatus Paceibacteria bacterium]|jgi:pyruvate/2-oxoglutarate dehydrogenase complex dihydrolipoamide dehydrogenase (E3) component